MLLVLHTLYTSSTRAYVVCTYSGEKKGKCIHLLSPPRFLYGINLRQSWFLPSSLPPSPRTCLSSSSSDNWDEREETSGERQPMWGFLTYNRGGGGRSCPPPFFFSSGNGHLWSGDPGNNGIKVRSSHPPPILLLVRLCDLCCSFSTGGKR